MPRLSHSWSLLAMALASGRAAAQTPPWSADDAVVLRDGTWLEGHAIDIRLGERVTVQGADGTLRVLRWTELRSARGPSFDALLRPADTASRVPPPPPGAAFTRVRRNHPFDPQTIAARYLEPREGRVPVTLESQGPALVISAVEPYPGEIVPTLNGASGEGSGDGLGQAGTSALRLCTTPCTLYLPPGRTRIHIGGRDRLESLETLEVGTRPQRVRLHSSSATLAGLGFALTIFGASFVFAGATAAVAHFTNNVSTGGPSLLAVGGVLFGIGVVNLTVGLPLAFGARVGVARIDPLQRPTRDVPRARLRLTAAGAGPSSDGRGAQVGLAFSF